MPSLQLITKNIALWGTEALVKNGESQCAWSLSSQQSGEKHEVNVHGRPFSGVPCPGGSTAPSTCPNSAKYSHMKPSQTARCSSRDRCRMYSRSGGRLGVFGPRLSLLLEDAEVYGARHHALAEELLFFLNIGLGDHKLVPLVCVLFL